MNLSEVVKQLGIKEDYLIPYGGYAYKVDLGALGEQKGKLVLVTSINPTPAGEGKTTTAIGLADALAASGKKAVVTLREPSLGLYLASKVVLLVAGRLTWCLLTRLTCISPATCMRSQLPITS